MNKDEKSTFPRVPGLTEDERAQIRAELEAEYKRFGRELE